MCVCVGGGGGGAEREREKESPKNTSAYLSSILDISNYFILPDSYRIWWASVTAEMMKMLLLMTCVLALAYVVSSEVRTAEISGFTGEQNDMEFNPH